MSSFRLFAYHVVGLILQRSSISYFCAFRKWCELKERELTLQQRLLALEEERLLIERAKRFRTQ